MTIVPKLRFKEFELEWEEKKFGSIYSFYSTNSLSRDKLNYESGKVFNIHYGDIHTKFSTMFVLDKELTPLINSEVDLSKYTEEKYCQVGDLVIADASEDFADIGKTIELISLSNERVLAGLHTFLARPNKFEMALGFAGYLMQSWNVRKQVMVIAQGTKVLGIATGRLANVKLFIPEYEEQKKIADFLSSVDNKLQNLKKKKELLEQYKKGLMQKIFSQEIRFKDDNGNDYPDWEEKRLGEIMNERNTKAPKSDRFPLMSFVAYRGVSPKGERYNREFLVNNEDNKKYKQTEYGDFIYSSNNLETGSIGLNRYGDASISPVYSIFIVGDLYDNQFIGSYLLQKRFINKMIKYRQGVVYGQWRIHESNFLKIKEKFPSLPEQKKIAEFLSSVDKKIGLVDTQITQTESFKKGLLQQMFV